MPIALDVVLIELLNPHTKYMQIWEIKNPNPPNGMTIEETLEIPSTTPPGQSPRCRANPARTKQALPSVSACLVSSSKEEKSCLVNAA